MIKKIFPVLVFLFYCNENIVLQAQYLLTRDTPNRESYVEEILLVDESLVSYQVENPFGEAPPFSTLTEGLPGDYDNEAGCIAAGYVWDSEWGECYESMGGDTPNPGDVPIGDSYGFWLFATLLYGLTRYYKKNRKKSALR